MVVTRCDVIAVFTAVTVTEAVSAQWATHQGLRSTGQGEDSAIRFDTPPSKSYNIFLLPGLTVTVRQNLLGLRSSFSSGLNIYDDIKFASNSPSLLRKAWISDFNIILRLSSQSLHCKATTG